jgi:hypothetical protein
MLADEIGYQTAVKIRAASRGRPDIHRDALALVEIGNAVGTRGGLPANRQSCQGHHGQKRANQSSNGPHENFLLCFFLSMASPPLAGSHLQWGVRINHRAPHVTYRRVVVTKTLFRLFEMPPDDVFELLDMNDGLGIESIKIV